MMTLQPHIKCKEGDVARYALIPGDPARVKLIAKHFDNPKEIAFNREFLTITGKYKGVSITATSTGIGCPSAAIAIEELANIGVDTFIRVGTCGALQKDIRAGDLIIPFAAIRAEGTTKEYIPLEFPAVATPEIYQASLKDDKIKDLSKEEKLKGANYYLNIELFSITTSRYRHKQEQIEKMVEDDRKKQDFYDSTSEPSNIICNKCGKRLFSETKILEDYMDSPMRVLFYFPCKTCKIKRAVYNTGEEFESKPSLCPKCKHELNEKHTVKAKGKNKIITWIRTCPKCKFTETDIDDFEKSHLEWEKRQQGDKELLAKYRDEYCLSEEKGKENAELIEAMKYAHEVFEEEKQKYDNIAYQKTIQLKQLSIVELEKLLSELLEKERYIKLSFDKPNIGQFVMVPFTAQDADSSRKGHDSTKNLEKMLKATLDGTNWRLLSNSLMYRLGYVSGQLKGYEREEDLLELEGVKKEQKPLKDDSERRMKYGSHSYVQLARMIGKHESIENMRKRRLDKEPDGFFLEATESPYTCSICGELTPGNTTWWNLDGLRCKDCWRNIQEGVIPALTRENDNIWIKEWQFQSDYSIHPSTRRKLIREGLLHGRELKRQDGTTYDTVYLVEENKEFFKKYPKKPKMKIEWKTVDEKGNEVKF